jgi:hypothetical protein
MADSKLSELTSTSSATSTDLLYLVQSSSSKKITAGNLIVSLTQLRSAPTNAFGVANDKAGMIAFDSDYFYVCTANYTSGSINIWRRVSITSW